MTDDPLTLAEELLWAVKRDGDASEPRAAIAALDPDDLAAALSTRTASLAFWLDVYNASAQLLLREEPSLFEKRWLSRPVFREPLVTVAGHDRSLDDIEHGILRGSMSGIGLGYLPRLRPDAFEKRFRLEEVDPRIHFALNCGAASCPPVAVYTADGIDDELDRATESFLTTECEYDPESGVVHVSRLFRWYRGDFGGKSGVIEFLRRYGVVPEDRSPSLSYRPYDWSLKLGEFRDRAEA